MQRKGARAGDCREMLGDFIHASPGARCADTAALAGEGDGTRMAAGCAAKVDKTLLRIAAVEEVAKRLFDEVR